MLHWKTFKHQWIKQKMEKLKITATNEIQVGNIKAVLKT